MLNKDHITVCLGTPTLGMYQPLQPRALCAVAPPLLAILEVSRTLGTLKKNIRGTPVYNKVTRITTTGLMLSSLMLPKAEVPISKSELAPSTGRGP